jgi:hypothetical protein
MNLNYGVKVFTRDATGRLQFKPLLPCMNMQDATAVAQRLNGNQYPDDILRECVVCISIPLPFAGNLVLPVEAIKQLLHALSEAQNEIDHGPRKRKLARTMPTFPGDDDPVIV